MPTTKVSSKQRMIRILREQPEDSSSEELLRELAFDLMIERGTHDADAGRTISNAEMKRRIKSWRK